MKHNSESASKHWSIFIALILTTAVVLAFMWLLMRYCKGRTANVDLDSVGQPRGHRSGVAADEQRYASAGGAARETTVSVVMDSHADGFNEASLTSQRRSGHRGVRSDRSGDAYKLEL